MNNVLLPLLSSSLKGVLSKISIKHPSCSIVTELLQANDLINKLTTKVDVFDDSDEDYKLLGSLITNEIRMLSVRQEDLTFSFLPKNKIPTYSSDSKWTRKNRQSGRPGKIVQKLLKKRHTCKEFEDFSNYVKETLAGNVHFTIVSGKEISDCYNQDNYYSKRGTIGNSCMRYEYCKDFLQLYEDNARLLVTKKSNKITGRAILWEVDGVTYMDRVYTFADYLYDMYVDYAKEHNWVIRSENTTINDGDVPLWLSPVDNYKSARIIDLTIHLVNDYNHEFPFLDSFRYYNNSENTISTSPLNGEYYLSETDGGKEWYSLSKRFCYNCGKKDDDTTKMFASRFHNGFLCSECAVYCDGLEDYVSKNINLIDVYYPDELTYTYPESYIKEHSNFIKFENKYYDLACFVDVISYNETTKTYKILFCKGTNYESFTLDELLNDNRVKVLLTRS